MEIHLKTRNCYGQDRFYPANRTAEIFCQLLKTKTFVLEMSRYVKELGYKIKIDGNYM